MASSSGVLDHDRAVLLRREVSEMTMIQGPVDLEAGIRHLQQIFLELSRIRESGPVWVSAGSVAAELEKLLENRECRSGMDPGPAQ